MRSFFKTAFILIGLGFAHGTAQADAQTTVGPRPIRGILVRHKCIAGDEACPVALLLTPGSDTIEATGSVSGEHPDYYFKFDAKAGAKLTVHVTGGNIKAGAGIPITLPDGSSDAVDEGQPYPLPATGTYIIRMHANTMSDGPFGKFRLKLHFQ